MIPTAGAQTALRQSTISGTYVMDKTRRGNYDSGEDFVLEYGELALHLQRGGLRGALRAGRH